MKSYFALGCVLTVCLASCSGPEATTEKKAEKPAEKSAAPVTGQSALFKMFQVARSWSPDAQVVKMNSIPITEVKPEPGKAGAWQAFFASPEKSRVRSYTFSVVEAEGNIHEGVFAGSEEPWSGPRDSAFVIAAVKVDTDAAFKTAQGKIASYRQQTEGKPVSFLLEKTKKFPNPVWRVIWGESVGTAALSIYIDANTGAYLETMH